MPFLLLALLISALCGVLPAVDAGVEREVSGFPVLGSEVLAKDGVFFRQIENDLSGGNKRGTYKVFAAIVGLDADAGQKAKPAVLLFVTAEKASAVELDVDVSLGIPGQSVVFRKMITLAGSARMKIVPMPAGVQGGDLDVTKFRATVRRFEEK